MKLRSLYLQSFRSFRKRQVLNVGSLNPGLYLVRGANGAGKSSLFEALFFASFGKTSRNLKPTVLKNRYCKLPLRVITICDDLPTINRVWSAKDKTLHLGGELATQEQLDKLIGLSADAFLQVVYFAQNAPAFIDLRPAQRMELYSDLMGLGYWEEKAQLAKKLDADYEVDKVALEKKLAAATGAREALEAEDVEELAASWEKERRQRLAAQDTMIEAAEAELKRQRESLKVANDNVQVLSREDTKLRKQLEEAEVELKEIIEEVASVKSSYVRKQQELVRQYNDLKNFGRLAHACPTCGQDIKANYKETHRQHLRDLAHQLERECDGLKNQLARISRMRTKKEDQIGKLKDNVPDLAMFKSLVVGAHAKTDEAERDLARTKKRAQEITTELNPWQQKVREKKEKLSRIAEQVRKQNQHLEKIRWLQNAFVFWSKRFMDLRFFLIQESLEQLNLEVNESLVALGLPDWKLSFGVERENKSGSVTRGFLCTVSGPEIDDVPWETWSGGESQRFRLAIQLGVSNLLSARAGINLNFEFFDEPTTWLEDQGIEALLDVLRDRAKRYERRLFIADHRILDYPFDGVLDVTKTNEGSILKWKTPR